MAALVPMYRLSERVKSGIYMEYAKELIDKGEAYYCFCDKERLESPETGQLQARKSLIYDKHCLTPVQRRGRGKS